MREKNWEVYMLRFEAGSGEDSAEWLWQGMQDWHGANGCKAQVLRHSGSCGNGVWVCIFS